MKYLCSLICILVPITTFIFFISIMVISYERNYNSTYLSFLRRTIFYLPILQSLLCSKLIKAASKSCDCDNIHCNVYCIYLFPHFISVCYICYILGFLCISCFFCMILYYAACLQVFLMVMRGA
jgi:hypothetical protein